MWNQLDEIEKEILRKYKPALRHLRIDFSREDVQDAIRNCSIGLEPALQATIGYCFYLLEEDQPQYPNAILIQALSELWHPKPGQWNDQWLYDDPRFKSHCQLWWEEVAEKWGYDLRNSLVASVREDDNGYEDILFTNGKTLSLARAKSWGWDKVLEIARE
jgi:predicted RNA-binding protein with PUA-like domain